jgi:hypothetical protein
MEDTGQDMLMVVVAVLSRLQTKMSPITCAACVAYELAPLMSQIAIPPACLLLQLSHPRSQVTDFL